MYPIWEVPNLSAGIVLALMATFHILPSHLSVSAIWFNVYVETKAYRENRPELLEFIKKYSLLLLVFSYVLGSLSGIGIWYSATVANPRGISGLIHNYVWGWATEWVFFIIEVIGIFIYYYTLGKVDKKTHLKIGWIFAIGSWTTMVIIVGILAFMLSSGKWPETGNFFDGFFNQTYWSQLLMRTTLMFGIAAAYAIAVATRIKNADVRAFITKTASRWGIAGLILGSILFLWYLKTLPDANRMLITVLAPQGLKTGIIVSSGVLVLYFIYANVKPLGIRLVPAILAIAVLFGGIWSTERIREMIRKPYIISQYMYSNQIIGKDVIAKGVSAEAKIINEKGILKFAPFVPDGLREINEGNQVQVGKMIALIECSSCHVFDEKGLRAMPQMVKRLGFKEAEAVEGFLDGLGGYPYMPPFVGTAAERKALATYLVSLNK
ncbi:MAG: cytochrome ubiquinol oxidase subunit I [Nitrospirae bacterium]|nr:cytochrome ubiquinol oxidase subunit I [Nitrospirota bacterium]